MLWYKILIQLNKGINTIKWKRFVSSSLPEREKLIDYFTKQGFTFNIPAYGSLLFHKELADVELIVLIDTVFIPSEDILIDGEWLKINNTRRNNQVVMKLIQDTIKEFISQEW